jgi:hypothetical protein
MFLNKFMTEIIAKKGLIENYKLQINIPGAGALGGCIGCIGFMGFMGFMGFRPQRSCTAGELVYDEGQSPALIPSACALGYG